MENLEQRVQLLEKKCRVLMQTGFVLMLFVAYAAFSGTIGAYRDAQAQAKGGGEPVMKGDGGDIIGQQAPRIRARARRAARNRAAQQQESGEGAPTEEQVPGQEGLNVPKKDPKVVEGEIFILKDSQGNIRGVWSADDETTSLAMTYKENHPIIGMAVDQSNATLSLTDSRQGKISLSLADSIRSISIMDETEKNNVYMGLTGSGDASFDMVSTKSSSMVIDGSTSRIDLTGDKAIVALAETVGGTVALQAAPSIAALTYVDFRNNPTMKLSSIDGMTEVYMQSPAKKEKKVLTTEKEVKPEEKENQQKAQEGQGESSEAKAPETEAKAAAPTPATQTNGSGK